MPVIEFYGMTEAANQITSNPLPPARRKPGSVGRPEGPAVAIAEATGRLIGAREIGEVVVRGENVTSGYERPSPRTRRSTVHQASEPATRATSTKTDTCFSPAG